MTGEPDPDFEVPVAMFQDMEDMKAKLKALTSQVQALTAAANADPHEASVEDTDDAGDDGPEAAAEEDEWQYPPFILLLDSPMYDDELRAVTEWVEGVLVPGYLAEPSADARWCHLWFEHPVAVARLHALWLAWQELTDPATCGYTGPSVWHRDHYDPCMRELRASHGPFQGCTKNENTIQHRMPTLVPSAWRHEHR
ncbi:DUF4913 domain-containing protein [Streptomyces sp. ID01-12c]|uniref:DUF4913 domain-containing protein n=1 Tax=Streptomyces caniscabiei TaxID=2746961 RepID=UPI00178037FE|nr:DUF4913 domain-containing protein [Streptomyces caniscabiei]MBD9701778.1 DUF4913 domain-containing protein [Streptomyces caniscabiei]MDX3726475.1 DUF4913 domain-containing protein [Streptomyces caniscabiei]